MYTERLAPLLIRPWRGRVPARDRATLRSSRQASLPGVLAGWSFGAIPSVAGPVTGLQPAADGPTLRLADGQVSLTRSVLITTGVSYRRLDAPGLDSLLGAGVFHGATASEAAAFAREHVFIAGGANSAGQAAVNQAHIMTGSGSHPLPCPNCRRPRTSADIARRYYPVRHKACL